jgi:hypothetical protein
VAWTKKGTNLFMKTSTGKAWIWKQAPGADTLGGVRYSVHYLDGATFLDTIRDAKKFAEEGLAMLRRHLAREGLSGSGCSCRRR